MSIQVLLAIVVVGGIVGPSEQLAQSSGLRIRQAATSISALSGTATPAPPLTPPTNTLVPTETTNGLVVGRTDGSGTVTSDGAAQYTLPLWVPPGRAGIQPDLSLVYNSSGGNGLLGVGWSLTGLSQITRCRKTFLQDGDPQAVHFNGGNNGDRLCLNGQRLVVVGGLDGATSTYGADWTEYRTENDIHAKIVSYASDAYGPGLFKVYLKDGRILTFGGLPDSKVEGQRVYVQPATRSDPHGLPIDDVFLTDHNQHVRYAWQLYRIEDRAGNYLTIRYKNDTANNASENLPVAIDYTAFDGAVSLPATRSVQLSYESRPDANEYYVSGFKLKSTQRLKRIEMRWTANPQTSVLLRSYELQYRNDSFSKRSLLSQVQECDGSHMCKPATKFEWSLGDGSFTDIDSHLTGWQPSVTSTSPSYTFVETGDINGDGLDDIFAASDGTGKYLVSTGNGFQPLPGNQGVVGLGCKTASTPGALPCPEGRLIDVNGDGRADYIRVDPESPGGPWPSGDTFRNQVYLSTPSGFTLMHDKVETFQMHTKPTFVLDINGDGLPDLVNRLPTVPGDDSVSMWAYRLNTNGSFSDYIETAYRYSEPNPQLASSGPKGFGLDLDGSGRGSLLIPGSGSSRYSGLSIQAGMAQTEDTSIILPRMLGNPSTGQYCNSLFLDVNGDGLADWVSTENAKDFLNISINTGHGFSEPVKWSIPQPYASSPIFDCNDRADRGMRIIDYNGDGRQDLLVMSGYVVPNTTGFRSLFILESTGSGFTPISFPTPLSFPAGQSSGSSSVIHTSSGSTVPLEDWKLSQVLDVNGDGLDDFVQVVNGTLHLYTRGGGKADTLMRVVDGLGAIEQFEYRPLSDVTVYTPGSDCSYPQACLKRALWVVSLHKMDTGTPVTHDVKYFYQDGLVDMAGRGWIGFAQLTTTDMLTRTTTRITYDNQTRKGTFYPCAALPKIVTTDVSLSLRLPFFPVVHRRTDVMTCQVVTQVNEKLYFSYPATIDTTEWEGTRFSLTLLRKEMASQVQDIYANVTQTERLTYAIHEGQPTGRADKLTVTTTYDNFEASWLIGQMMHVLQTSTTRSGHALTRETAYEYYPDTGLLWKTLVEPQLKNMPESDGSDYYLETAFERDVYGLVTAVKQVGSGQTRTEKLEYDDTDHTFPKSDTDAAGHTRLYIYHPGLGVLAAERDANGLDTLYQYDGFARLRFVNTPDSADIAFHYDLDADGHPRIIEMPTGGAATFISYDRLGREIARQWESFDGSLVGTETTYDAQGHIQSVSRPHLPSVPANVRSFTYDNLDRPLLMTQPDGTSQIFVYEGLKTLHWDEKGNQSFVVQDELGRIASSVNVDEKGRELLTRYDYGPFDVLTDVLDSTGQTTFMEYDRLGRRTKLVDLDSGTHLTHYNAFGEVKDETDGNGNQTKYTRDALGRIKTITNKDGITTCTWDTANKGIGMLAATSSPDGITTQYTYDAISRLQQATWIIEGNNYSFQYTYDTFSRLKTLTYPTVAGHAKFTVQHNYTPRGDLQSVQDVSGQHVYWTALKQNASGQLTEERLGNNLTTTRGYDDTRGWLRSIDTQTAAGTKVQALEYEYESNGNLHRRDDHLLNTMEEFSYDFLDRVTEWDISQLNGKTTTNYGYNDVGNLMSRTVTGSSKSSETYTYGTGNAGLHAVTQITSSNTKKTYTYDADGNQKTGPGRTANYTMFNLPSRMWGGSTDISFKYDAMHNRVLKKQTNGKATVYVDNLYEKRTAAGTTSHVFYIQGEGRTVAQILWTQKGSTFGADKLLYLHDDHLGSIETITDASGKVVEHLKYDPFGARRNSQNLAIPISQSPVDVHRGFTDQEHDDEFALMNMHGRMYDATVGRFLSADPLVGDPFFGQSYNRYSYVLNNPLSYTDPTGFSSVYTDPSTGESIQQTTVYGHSENPDTGTCTGECTFSHGEVFEGPSSNNQSMNSGQKVADDQGNHTLPSPASLQSAGETIIHGARNKSNSTPESGQQAVPALTRGFVTLPGHITTSTERYGAQNVDVVLATGKITINAAEAVVTYQVVGGLRDTLKAATSGILKIASFTVTEEGILAIEQHLAKIEALKEPPNIRMLERIRAGLRGGNLSEYDVRFYEHELKEWEFVKQGLEPRAAHLETLKWQGIPYEAGYESKLYDPDVIFEFSEWFSPAAHPSNYF